jgi:hypothetical protein
MVINAFVFILYAVRFYAAKVQAVTLPGNPANRGYYGVPVAINGDVFMLAAA